MTWPFGDLPMFGAGLIMADPPWGFENWSEAGRARNPGRHYQTMPIEAICALPVGHLAARDCALVMWVTSDAMPFAGQVMAAWGFRFVSTAFVWVKTCKDDPTRPRMGQGYTTRKSCEIALLGFNGAPKRRDAGVGEVIMAPRREHSRKPDEAYERARRLYPGPHLELFSRETRPGWQCWGAEAGKFDAPAPLARAN